MLRMALSFFKRAVVLLLMLLPMFPLSAQTTRDSGRKETKTTAPVKKIKEVVADTIPFYNGFSIGTNLLGYAEVFTKSKTLSPEVALQVSLKQRYFPVLEVGISRGTIPVYGGGEYRLSGDFYGRVGVDCRVMGDDQKNFFFVGVRYGFSPFSYQITGAGIENPYWPDNQLPFKDQKISTTAHFFSGVLGLRVSLSRFIAMGWNVRYNYLLDTYKSDYAAPSFIPGYGMRGSNNGGVSIQYMLYFKM